MSSSVFFLIYLLTLALTASAVILLIFWRVLLRRGLISRSLNLALILVRFPPQFPQENITLQQIREKIALMEQFYANLAGLGDKWWRILLYGKPSFALELAIPQVGEELTFYVAVPRRIKGAVEKIIQGIFPDAHIEDSRDYNIFNPEGAAVGSEAALKKNRYYPIRTYQKLEVDPIKELTNVFSKLAKVGEGASFQIVARPAKKKWAHLLKETAKLLYQGKEKEDILSKTIGMLGEIMSGPVNPQEKSLKQEEPKRITPLQEEIVRALEGKASKPLFEVNIRLLASAPDESRARAILQGLELALSQFTDPNLNSFKIFAVDRRAFKDLVFNFSFRNFDEKRISVLSTEELTSLFHFPNIVVETPKIKVQKAREAPPPPNLPEKGLLLGYSLFRGEKQDVRILEEDRRRHLYIIGQTGTGKTAFMQNMAVQDIREGRGVGFIDPHGDVVEELLGFVPRHRLQDVIYFNPGDVEHPMGLNMLEYDPLYPEQKTLIVNELLAIFDKLFNMSLAGGPMFEQYFRNATLLVMDDPPSGNTILEIERVFAEKDFREYKLSRSKNIVVKNFWKEIAEKAGGEAALQNMTPYVVSKIDNFIANEIMRPIVAQEKSAFNFREVMDNQKILLVNLSKGRLGELNSSFIGMILVGKLLMAALSRTDMPEEKRKDFYLYIDEFQNATTDSIATILAEARKYRLDLIIAHQFIGQLKEEIKKAVFGNVGSIISFRIGSDDGEFMAKQYKPLFSEQDLLNIDNFNCYVKLLIKGSTSPPFNMRTYPPEKGDRAVAETIKEISRVKYGRPREEIEEEIIARHEKFY